MEELNYEELIGQWHKDRNLINGSTDKDQYMKLIQEAGELSDSLCKGKDIKDACKDWLIAGELGDTEAVQLFIKHNKKSIKEMTCMVNR